MDTMDGSVAWQETRGECYLGREMEERMRVRVTYAEKIKQKKSP